MIKEIFFFRLALMSTQSWLYRILAYAGAMISVYSFLVKSTHQAAIAPA